MSWLAIIGAGLQLVLLLAQFIIKKIDIKDADVEGAFREGKDAIKNRDDSAFNFAVQRLNRLQHGKV